MNFKDFKLKNNILSTLSMEGFFEPTKIQEKFIPLALKNNDILAKSETGSGKTLAYSLPILNNIENDGVQALIVAPTKELVIQTKNVLDKFTKYLNLKVCSLYGGSDFTRQRFNLKTANIVVSTTGRLLDHLERRTIKLHRLKFLVLDEADEMLNMGFIDDIKRIYKATPKIKQTFMLSATFTEKVKNLANDFLKEPTIIEFSSQNKVVDTIKQCYIQCLKKGKFETLLKFLNTLYKEKTIIFVNTKKMAEELFFKLKEKDIKTTFLHGDLNLKERKAAINVFKSFNSNILIATDVASRGLDIDNVEFIINYDMPQDSDTYIHRIGRTARAGKSGMSLSLINSQTQLEYLFENFSQYNLIELKVKKDDKTNQIIFIEEKHKNFNFVFNKKKESKLTLKEINTYKNKISKKNDVRKSRKREKEKIKNIKNANKNKREKAKNNINKNTNKNDYKNKQINKRTIKKK